MKILSDLPWIKEAIEHIGTREIRGGLHNPKIIKWFAECGATWIDNDETPWCGAFLAHCLIKANRPIPSSENKLSPVRALDWSRMGMTKLSKPAFGSVFVMSRHGGGHVGFVVGKKGNQVQILGGNQNDSVRVSNFGLSNLVGFYWPNTQDNHKSNPLDIRYDLQEVSGASLIKSVE